MKSNQFCIDSELKESEIYQKIAFIIDEIVLTNRKEASTISEEEETPEQSFFNSKKMPSISILEYIKRIIHYTNINLSTLIISMIYLDVVCTSKRIHLNRKCVHRFVFISLLVSIKYNEDENFTNKFYSKVGGISLEETNFLELEFLKLLDYKLYITEEAFNVYTKYILKN